MKRKGRRLLMPKCYACDNPGKPRDVGGTVYYLCDECYGIHVAMNKLALACLYGQLIIKKREAVSCEAI